MTSEYELEFNEETDTIYSAPLDRSVFSVSPCYKISCRMSQITTVQLVSFLKYRGTEARSSQRFIAFNTTLFVVEP